MLGLVASVRRLRDTSPEEENFDGKHAFYCGQDRPNAVLHTSNPVSNWAVVTARGTPGITRLWDNLAGVGYVCW